MYNSVFWGLDLPHSGICGFYLLLFAYLDLVTQIVWFHLDLVSGLVKDQGMGMATLRQTCVWYVPVYWVRKDGPEYLRFTK